MAFSYNSDTALSNKEDTRPDLSVDVSGADLDDDDTTNSQTSRVSKEDIWKELVKSSYGRDKTLVIHLCSFLQTSINFRETETYPIRHESVCFISCGVQ
jgi:hypothetical protein